MRLSVKHTKAAEDSSHADRLRDMFSFAPGQDASTDVCTADFCIIQGQSMVGPPFTPLSCTPAPENDEDCTDFTANVSAAPVNGPSGLSFSINPSGLLIGNMSRQWNMSAAATTPTGTYEVAVTYEDYQTNPGPGLIWNMDGNVSVQVLCSLSLGNCAVAPGPGASVQCVYESTFDSSFTVSFAKKRSLRDHPLVEDATAVPTTAPGAVVVANPCSPLPSLASPPPPPQPNLPSITMLLGQTADFSFTDAADSTQGALTWNVTPMDQTQPVYSLSNTQTQAAPHSNDVSFPTTANTKAGLYTIGVSVTSQVTGLTSSATLINLTDLIPISYSTYSDSLQVEDQPTSPYTFQTSYATSAMISGVQNFQSQFDTGSDNVFPVDAFGSNATSIRKSHSLHASKRKFVSGLPMLPVGGVSGTPINSIPCGLDAFANARVSELVISDVTIDCGPGTFPIDINYELESFDANQLKTTVSQPGQVDCNLSITSVCFAPGPVAFTIAGPTSINTVWFAVTVANAYRFQIQTSTQGIYFGDFYPYNDKAVPYPQKFPFGQSEYMPFPGPPFIDCRGISAQLTSSCSEDTNPSSVLRANMVLDFPPTYVPSVANYQAHHIKPTSCGGSNLSSNGAFLTAFDHNGSGQVTTWWRFFSPCGRDGVPAPSSPVVNPFAD